MKGNCKFLHKGVQIMSSVTKGFWVIFVGIPQHQIVYLIYVPSTRKIVCSRDVVSDETFSSELAHTWHTYSDALTTQPAVAYILYATSYHEQTGDIITSTQFEEVNLVETNTM